MLLSWSATEYKLQHSVILEKTHVKHEKPQCHCTKHYLHANSTLANNIQAAHNVNTQLDSKSHLSKDVRHPF